MNDETTVEWQERPKLPAVLESRIAAEPEPSAPQESPSAPKGVLPTGYEMYAVGVRCRRIVEHFPLQKKARTEEGVYVLAELPGASELQVRKIYWSNLPHRGPELLDIDGKPLRMGRVKSMKHLVVWRQPREKALRAKTGEVCEK